jgi:hypothetical protein
MNATTNPKDNPEANPKRGSESDPPDAGPHDHNEAPAPDSTEKVSRGAQGRYGVSEEGHEGPTVADTSQSPKDSDQIARDADRDAEVKNTGEDLGG